MLTQAAADAILTALPGGAAPFALAFSGGGDSLALLNILKDHKSLKAVLHVDHGLREESQAEAESARELVASMGHELTVLTWTPGSPTSGLQAKARQARYGLMGDVCRARGIETLVTGHHADDQAETVLMRLKRASGWRGAAGMLQSRYAPVWPELAGVTLLRPSLGVRREALRSNLPDLQPIEDRSNEDRTFERVRVRKELADTPGLADDMLDLSRDMRRGLEADRARLAREFAGCHLTHEGQFSVPRLLGVEALMLVAPIVGGQGGPADRTRLSERLGELRSGKTVSLGAGCMGQWDGEILTLSRDPVAITGRKDRRLAPTAVAAAITPDPLVWDGRFMLTGAAGQIHPERRGVHVGYRIHYGRGVRVRNLVQDRLRAALTLS